MYKFQNLDYLISISQMLDCTSSGSEQVLAPPHLGTHVERPALFRAGRPIWHPPRIVQYLASQDCARALKVVLEFMASTWACYDQVPILNTEA